MRDSEYFLVRYRNEFATSWGHLESLRRDLLVCFVGPLTHLLTIGHMVRKNISST